MRVLSVGTSCLDVSIFPVDKLPRLGERSDLSQHAIAVAGNALCAAICAKRLGATSSALVTALGRDFAGELVQERLRAEGVELFNCGSRTASTSLSVVAVAKGGEKRIFSSIGASPIFLRECAVMRNEIPVQNMMQNHIERS